MAPHHSKRCQKHQPAGAAGAVLECMQSATVLQALCWSASWLRSMAAAVTGSQLAWGA